MIRWGKEETERVDGHEREREWRGKKARVEGDGREWKRVEGVEESGGGGRERKKKYEKDKKKNGVMQEEEHRTGCNN